MRVDPDGTTRRVEVPVELPEGVSYEGIFGSGDEADGSVTLGGAPRQTAGTGARVSGGFNAPASAPPPTAPVPSGNTSASEADLRQLRVDRERTEEAAPEPEDALQVVPRLEVVRADGLDEEAIAELAQYLQNAAIAPNVEGEMVLELRFRNGRTDKVLLDDVASALTDVDVLNELKRLLLSWQPPASVGNKLTITVRVRKL